MTDLSPQLLLYIVTAGGLFGIGLYGFIVGPQTLRRILALNIIGAGIFMLMVVLAYRGLADDASLPSTDPVLHALILTGLVVAVSATAFALALLARLNQAKAAQCSQDQLRHKQGPGQ
ncbi:multicomponent Na+:H+ antiporter subunit C [Rheinheimera pacifica]|uniref:NADH-quinone oxidoreductase subunit K n=1 Tax=Rheinheimera pacifica TaxID=173990 RepID=UPI0021684126|nr:NADH-quinone oxidoreductase subunit K [Rheinheimera pacifica]MCS4307984.1 multicomponent Na+:H+ antiporter subunit C [Rheinheimera pacifica]